MCNRLKTYFVAVFFIALIFPRSVLAQVVINEFSSNSDIEWVEIFNTSDQVIDLSSWELFDQSEGSSDISLNGCISPMGFRSFEKNAWLNNSGDTVNLKNGQDNILDQVTYGPGGIIGIPPDGKSGGRSPDGSSNWVIIDSPTRRDDTCSLPSLTPTVTPLPTVTVTPIPATKANYKINEVKDSDGTVISSVEIYVDGNYVHHFAPETLEFCEGCHCDDDKNVDCGLGEHTIKLEKESYADWSENKTFSVGNNFEVNPILSKNSPTVTNIPATPVPTSTPRPTSTPKPTVTPKLSPTPSLSKDDLLASESAEEILGIDISQAATESSVSQEKKKKFNFWPFVFIIPGLGMISFSVLLLRKQKI